MKSTRKQQKTIIMQLAYALTAACLVVFIGLPARGSQSESNAAAAKSTPKPSLLPDAQLLAGSDEESEQALKKLEKRPRAEVVASVRDILNGARTPTQLSAVIRVALALKLHEVIPELRTEAKTSENWRLFHALNRLYRPEDRAAHSQLYLERLEKPLPNMTKAIVLEGLGLTKTALPNALWSRLLDDPSYEVRQALVAQFISARGAYSLEDQIAHYRSAFGVKPYEVRLMAMKSFAALNANDRKNLAAAVPEGLCSKEQREEVLPTCRQIAPPPAGGGK